MVVSQENTHKLKPPWSAKSPVSHDVEQPTKEKLCEDLLHTMEASQGLCLFITGLLVAQNIGESPPSPLDKDGTDHLLLRCPSVGAFAHRLRIESAWIKDVYFLF